MVRIAKRYAKALFSLTAGDLARAKKQRDSLVALKQLFEMKDSGRVLRSPVMPIDLKKSLLDYGLKQAAAEGDVSKLIDTILASERVDIIPQVADVYSELIDAAEGVVRAEIASATALKSDDLTAIAAALGQVLGKKVEAASMIDKDLLGGFVVRVGNYRIDMSLKSRLDGLAASAVQDSFRHS